MGPFSLNKDKLIRDLKMARMNVYYKEYISKSIRGALMMGTLGNVLFFFALMGLAKSTGNYALLLLLFLSVPLSVWLFFLFFMRMPETKIIRSKKNIDAEIISAIRFLNLDIKANASMFSAIENLSTNFDEIGKYLRNIIADVKLGTPLEKSLSDAVEVVPSESFRVFLWQILNHVQTGTDITKSLDTIANEIVELQRLNFRKYGKKLNVVSLFYMIVAIILPTIGFTIISAIMLFIGIQINLGIVVGFWLLFSILQVIFLAISGGNRPVVES